MTTEPDYSEESFAETVMELRVRSLTLLVGQNVMEPLRGGLSDFFRTGNSMLRILPTSTIPYTEQVTRGDFYETKERD